MKNLLAVIAIFWAISLSAQTETTNFPYNPDSNGDGFVGVADILELLNTFGQEFQVQVSLNTDSTSAIFFMHPDKVMSRYACRMSCDSLPGPWTILTEEGFFQHASSIRNSILSMGETFKRMPVIAEQPRVRSFNSTNEVVRLDYDLLYYIDADDEKWSYSSEVYDLVGHSTGDGGNWVRNDNLAGSDLCVCEIRQRRKVEYTQCEGNPQSVLECVQNKTEVGWYPLNLIPFGDNSMIQTLWRWKD